MIFGGDTTSKNVGGIRGIIEDSKAIYGLFQMEMVYINMMALPF